MSAAKDLVQRFYAAFAAGDVPGAFGLLDPDIAWREAERSPYFAGDVKGLDAVIKTVFEPIGGHFDGFAATPKEFVAEGDRVVALGEYSGTVKAGGRAFQAPFVHAWSVRDGRLASFVQYTDTALWNEALSGT